MVKRNKLQAARHYRETTHCPQCGGDIDTKEYDTLVTYTCRNPRCAWTYDRNVDGVLRTPLSDELRRKLRESSE